MNDGRYDAIIIGSGMGGLTAGALLAESGLKVLVLEQHYEVGGCASMFRRRKFLFDVAVHVVPGCEPGGELYNLYEKLGLLDQIDFVEVDPLYHMHVGNTVYELPANLDHLAQKMGVLFPEDRQAILETIEEIKWIGKEIVDGTFQKNPRTLQRASELYKTSFADYLAGRFHHPHTSIILGSLHFYAAVNITKLPTIFMMNLMMSYHNGAYYPLGGTQKLTHLLRDYIHSKNGKVLIKRKVEKILCDGNKVQGVIDHKGNQYDAPIIVSNADMWKTMRELLGTEYLPENYNLSMQKLIPSHSCVILYAALKNEGVTLSIPHELFIYPEYELLNDEQYLYQPLDPTTNPCAIVCRPSDTDKSLAPEGYSVISATVLCNRDLVEQVRAEKGKQVIADDYINFLESKLPGIKEQIVFYELATPSTLERYTLSSKGAIYGWEKSTQQPWMGRMGPNTPIKGLYMTGQWTPHIHGVFGACLSGRRTVDVILKDVGTTI